MIFILKQFKLEQIMYFMIKNNLIRYFPFAISLNYFLMIIKQYKTNEIKFVFQNLLIFAIINIILKTSLK